MREPEVVRAAEFLADHAVILLALGVVAAGAAAAAVFAAVRLIRHHRSVLADRFAWLVRHARRIAVVDRALPRSNVFLPSGYLLVHLILGLALTAAASAFVVLAEEVVAGGEVVAFDVALSRALREESTPEALTFFRAVSWLGEREALAVATIAVALRLLVTGNVVLALGWTAAQAAGGVLNLALKAAFERTRPEFADRLLAESSWSFPSGHAMGTFVLFGLGCYVLLRNVRSWTVATVAVTVSLAWCVTMAFSRLYLGAHFASDVAAGVVAGAAWVAVCASAFEVIRKRAAV